VRRVAIRRVVVALACALAAQGTATSVLERSLEEIFARADVVVYGEVVASDSEAVDDRIRTRVEIEVVRDIDGAGGGAGRGVGRAVDGPDDEPRDDEPVGDVRTVTFLAGQTPSGRTTVVDDVPMLARGDRILVAWYRDEGLLSPIVGVWQGLWRLGENGLVDLNGRVLGVDDGLITLGGVERDVDTVLDAIETALGDGDDVRLDDRVLASTRDDRQDASPGEPDPSPEASPDAELEAAPDVEAELATPPAEAIGTDEPVAPFELRLDVPDDTALRSALDAAVESWNDVGVPLRLVVDDDAPDRVTIGSLATFGSDALAYSQRVDGRDGVELLVRPGPEGLRVDVLARELGRWVGLPDAVRVGPDRAESLNALRSGTFPPGELLRPDEDDAAALLEARSGRPEDQNGDGVVDLYDLALLAEVYGSVGTRLKADLDGSGRVDDADLALLEEAYEFLPPSRDDPSERRTPQDGS